MKRNVFYSFHYQPDNQRAAKIRNIGVIEGNEPAKDNDWETIKSGGNKAIEKWIADQMHGSSCAVILIGAGTANRKWINHEIIKAWDKGMGVVGIRIHGITNLEIKTSPIGKNPFNYVTHGPTKKKLSSIVKCYDPAGASSKERYAWISKHLSNAVEEAIKIRKAN